MIPTMMMILSISQITIQNYLKVLLIHKPLKIPPTDLDHMKSITIISSTGPFCIIPSEASRLRAVIKERIGTIHLQSIIK